jgi:hypothetical protein
MGLVSLVTNEHSPLSPVKTGLWPTQGNKRRASQLVLLCRGGICAIKRMTIGQSKSSGQSRQQLRTSASSRAKESLPRNRSTGRSHHEPARNASTRAPIDERSQPRVANRRAALRRMRWRFGNLERLRLAPIRGSCNGCSRQSGRYPLGPMAIACEGDGGQLQGRHHAG